MAQLLKSVRQDSAPNSPELLLLKFLPLAYHHSHFLAITLDFTSFSQLHSWGPHTFFTAGLFWIRPGQVDSQFIITARMLLITPAWNFIIDISDWNTLIEQSFLL